jgi:hemerythrin
VKVLRLIAENDLTVMGRAWMPEYAVGHGVIDEQHKHILSLIDAVEYAAEGEGREHADVVLEHLQRYMRFHFDTEEQLLAEANFQGIKEHAQEHRELDRRISDYMARVSATGKMDLPEISRVLGEWVHQHMTGADQQWAQELFTS